MGQIHTAGPNEALVLSGESETFQAKACSPLSLFFVPLTASERELRAIGIAACAARA